MLWAASRPPAQAPPFVGRPPTRSSSSVVRTAKFPRPADANAPVSWEPLCYAGAVPAPVMSYLSVDARGGGGRSTEREVGSHTPPHVVGGQARRLSHPMVLSHIANGTVALLVFAPAFAKLRGGLWLSPCCQGCFPVLQKVGQGLASLLNRSGVPPLAKLYVASLPEVAALRSAS